jgi:hypothetical protein
VAGLKMPSYPPSIEKFIELCRTRRVRVYIKHEQHGTGFMVDMLLTLPRSRGATTRSVVGVGASWMAAVQHAVRRAVDMCLVDGPTLGHRRARSL